MAQQSVQIHLLDEHGNLITNANVINNILESVPEVTDSLNSADDKSKE